MPVKDKFILSKNDSHYFGVEITSFVSSKVYDSDSNQYLNYLQKTNLELLNSIINPADDRFIYEFRIIFVPSDTVPSVTFAYLVKCKQKEKHTVARYAESFLSLLRTYFQHLTLEQLSIEKLEYCLNPFIAKNVHETRRRFDIVNLDTLKFPYKLKRISEKVSSIEGLKDQSVVHIFRFIPSSVYYDRFLRMLYEEGKPLIISCTLKPIVFSNNYIEIFEKQIARCEKYAQIGISSLTEDISELFPTLQQQARLYQDEILRFYLGLRDNCALVQTRFASPEPISSLLLESFNMILTEPAGSYSDNEMSRTALFLKGGYITNKLEGDEIVENLKGINELDITYNVNKSIGQELSELLYHFDSNESGCCFKPPLFLEDNIPAVRIIKYKNYDIPFSYSPNGVTIGTGIKRWTKEMIKISDEDRKRHMYIVGQTGTGKSTLLKQMILSDIKEGKGLCLLDPHGDLYTEILTSIPKSRINDVVIINPNDIDFPIGMNILNCTDYSQSHFIAQEMVDITTKLIIDEYGANSVGQFAGPIFFQHMKMNLLLTMSNIDNPGTLLEFYQIFNQKEYWKRWLPLKVEDPLLRNWTEKILPLTDYTRYSADTGSMGSYVSSKFSSFIFDSKLRNIFAQKTSTISFKKIMDEGRIVLVNLAKGELTESTSKFFGMIILAKIQAELMQRLSTPPEKRLNFNLYVDEFQSIATNNFITLLSEGRKFGISLVLSNQFLFQVNQTIMNSIFGNCGTIICFRLGMEDAQAIEKKFHPAFKSSDLMNLPNWTACISTLDGGQITSPFTLETIYSESVRNDKITELVIESSRKKYTSTRVEVEKIIAESF